MSREDQRRLGDILQRVYDDVIRQGVPDRFKELLNELEGSREAGASTEEGRNPEAEHVVDAKGHSNKGSH